MSTVHHNTALQLARQHATRMLLQLRWRVHLDVIWDNTDRKTAYTDGRRFIALPFSFHGVQLDGKRLSKRARKIVHALTTHEVIHFLQPLRKLATVEQETGLNHFFCNVILDVHGERMIEKLFPKFAQKSLSALRSLVWKQSSKKWINGQALRKKFVASGKIDPSDLFRSEAGIMALFARFSAPRQPESPKSKKFALSSTGAAFVSLPYNPSLFSVPPKHSDLEQFYRDFAAQYPELCSPVLLLPSYPDGAGSSATDQQNETRENGAASLDNESEDIDADVTKNTEQDSKALDWDLPKEIADLIDAQMDIEILKGKQAVKGQPGTDAIKLAMKLSVMLNKTKVTEKITAPVNINRREIAIGINPQPWTMDIEKGKTIGRKLFIAVDYSGSMAGDIYNVLTAAQAISIAVKRDNGQVSALQFGDVARLDADETDAALFTPVKLQGATHFHNWLPYVWLKYPDSTVIVITDGSGTIPNPIQPEDHKRTHLILLGGGCNPSAAAMMGAIYHCPNLDKLPKILVDISNKALA